MNRLRFVRPAFEKIVVENNPYDGCWTDAADINADGPTDRLLRA